MVQTARYQPLVLVETENLTREKWLEYRRLGIGGSDAAAILGISPFRTARDLYYDKLGIETTDDEGNWVALEVGNLLEPLVARIFAKKTGLRVFQRKSMFQHPDYPWMLADLDYLVELPDGSIAILEIKTTNYKAKDKWWYNGQEIVPIYYESQGRHYMCVMNIDRVYYCCLYGNNEDEVIIRHIDRDMDYERELVAMERDFWYGNIQAKLPPPYTESGDLIMDSLRRSLGPEKAPMPPFEFSRGQCAAIQRYLELQKEKNKVQNEMERIKALLLVDMGQSTSGTYQDESSGFSVTYNPSQKSGITKDALVRMKEVHPEIYAEYVTVSESRRFNIRRTGPKAA